MKPLWCEELLNCQKKDIPRVVAGGRAGTISTTRMINTIPKPIINQSYILLGAMEPIDLYSLLKVGRDASEEEIHKAYKSLSTCFHPDKLPRTTSPERRDRIQQIFLEFKRASTLRSLVCMSSSSKTVFSNLLSLSNR